MRYLCDSNVFVALVTLAHIHHRVALQWFDGLGVDDGADFCRMTQSSFLRLLTTDQFMRPHTRTNEQALTILSTTMMDIRMGFAEEPPGLEKGWHMLASDTRHAPKLWMDAYLAAFAQLGGMAFVTFDKRFRQFASLDLIVLNSAIAP